jgi:hypothetical protein
LRARSCKKERESLEKIGLNEVFKKKIALTDAEKMYQEALRKYNTISLELAKLQIKMIEDIEGMADLLEPDDMDPFPVEAEYREETPRMIRIVTPLYPPKINVAIDLLAGRKPSKTAKNNPYIRTTYKEARDLWYKSITKALKEAAVPKLFMNKAIAWYTFYVPNGRTRDADIYAVRFVNNAFVRYGVLKDDNSDILRMVIGMEQTDKITRTEVVLVEDVGLYDSFKSSILCKENIS